MRILSPEFELHLGVNWVVQKLKVMEMKVGGHPPRRYVKVINGHVTSAIYVRYLLYLWYVWYVYILHTQLDVHVYRIFTSFTYLCTHRVLENKYYYVPSICLIHWIFTSHAGRYISISYIFSLPTSQVAILKLPKLHSHKTIFSNSISLPRKQLIISNKLRR